MDVTEDAEEYTSQAGSYRVAAGKVTFPESVGQAAKIKPLLPKLSKANLQTNIAKFSSYPTRYYKSQESVQATAWLKSKIEEAVAAAGARNTITVMNFAHSWSQPSIIATIAGKSQKTVVVGAHTDSTNDRGASYPAPGAGDNGSGTMAILEAFRVLIQDPAVASGQVPNTIEFHWYAAEEGGLLGSQAIFNAYIQQSRDVRAMLNQDMAGYNKRTLAAGKEDSLAIMVDNTDVSLTNFTRKVIAAYCDIPTIDTKCGYGCSDHASANKVGIPTAFVVESAFELSNPNLHTEKDTADQLSYDHMLQHSKMALGFAYELAYAPMNREVATFRRG